MAKALSIKLKEEVFQETEEIIRKIPMSRNSYINQALEHFNKVKKRRLLAEKLRQESKLVSKESLAVLGELELLEDELPL